MQISLEAKTHCEELMLKHIQENATEDLCARINAGCKTLAQCWNYIMSEAKKLAENGCVCIEDSTVFGWGMHFFEEDEINGEAYSKAERAQVVKSESATAKPSNAAPASKSKPKPKKVEQASLDQFSFDSLFG